MRGDSGFRRIRVLSLDGAEEQPQLPELLAKTAPQRLDPPAWWIGTARRSAMAGPRDPERALPWRDRPSMTPPSFNPTTRASSNVSSSVACSANSAGHPPKVGRPPRRSRRPRHALLAGIRRVSFAAPAGQPFAIRLPCMAAGFSMDASVRIEGGDRAASSAWSATALVRAWPWTYSMLRRGSRP